jgi:UDP-N-acetylglucosamine--dolichyl-phosphate N-acetylglucosaminephosphotransferase
MILAYYFGSWIRKYFKDSGLVGRDIHKEGEPQIPSSAGIPVFLSFYFASMMYVFLRTYLYQDYSGLLDVVAGILSIAFITFVGFLDDVYVARNKRIGLKQWQKPLLTIPAAIPLMALRLGSSTMSLPLIGNVNFGLF